MTSEQARELFSAAFEGELDEARARELQVALDGDPALAREYAQFVATLRLVQAAPAGPEPAPNLLPGVQRRLRARSRGRFYADRFAERLSVCSSLPLVLALVMLALLGLAWLGLGLLQQITLAH